ncbi:calcium-binding protein [Moorena sp. SIO4A1]|uniref:calcium-binding protein n=1 Tax=Moorena sp. SIO4A1 TaxID=2607835 RepID=UPI0025DB325F|nr:calcium-binding protein [Moorena sp. SIO4A1]
MGNYIGNNANNYFQAHKEGWWIFKKWKSWTMTGNGGDDTLIGGPKNDTLYGNSGNDKLYGEGGNDYLDGWTGNDYVYGGSGNDTLFGYSGHDNLYGNSGNDNLYGESGNDYLDGWTGNDNMYGGSGNDTLLGYSGNDYLSGSSGHDSLKGESGHDTLLGGTGTDTLVGGSGNDILNGYGGTIGEYDILSGDYSSSQPGVQSSYDGADTFVLGNAFGAFYLGSGYATITDFYWSEGDKFQVYGSSSDYSLSFQNWSGSSAKDTLIYYKNDLIGVVEDTTNVVTSADFNFV